MHVIIWQFGCLTNYLKQRNKYKPIQKLIFHKEKRKKLKERDQEQLGKIQTQ